jgi:SAM-dependent methyltransferase
MSVPARIASSLLPRPVLELLRRRRDKRAVQRYLEAGVPYTEDYDIYKRGLIVQALHDRGLLTSLASGEPLEAPYGAAVDERVIEFPWVISHLRPGRIMDAGSALNFEHILDHDVFDGVDLHIVTLAPEEQSFVERGLSYVFADLRDLPYRDGVFDTVVCLSTLEHVGLDNSRYTGAATDVQNNPDDPLVAMRELARVLQPGGQLLLTVPYGRPDRLPSMQVFDSNLLESAVNAFGATADRAQTFYRYSEDGWRSASADDCADAVYAAWPMLDPATRETAPPPQHDRAAAARAVACVRLVKG